MDKILLPQLVSLLAASTGKSKKDAELFLKAFVSVISDGLEQHDTIKIKGFGTFKTLKMQPRKSVNVTTGEEVEIPAHFKVVFTPSQSMADVVNMDFSWLQSVEIDEDTAAEDLDVVVADPAITFNKTAELSPIEEEPSEELREKIEKEFGEIEPAEPFGPVDPEDPEPGKPFPEDKTVNNVVYFGEKRFSDDGMPASKSDIEEVNCNIDTLQGTLDKNEKKNRRRYKTILTWSLLTLAIVIAGFLCLYFLWPDKIFIERGHVLAVSEHTEVENAVVSAENEGPTSEVTHLDEPTGSAEDDNQISESDIEPEEEEVAPTQPSDLSKHTDTISKSRFLTTMAREYYGNMNFWPYIYLENAAILGHPDRIKPGTQVVIPDLLKYGIDPSDPKTIEESIKLGQEIYSNFQ